MIWKFTKKYVVIVVLIATAMMVYQNCGQNSKLHSTVSEQAEQNLSRPQ